MRQTVAPHRGAWITETLRQDALLGEFTKASESRISEAIPLADNPVVPRKTSTKIGPYPGVV